MDTLIANATVVTVNEKLEVLFGAYLGVTDGKITYLDTTPPEEQPATILDGTGMVAMPGLVNCHTHLATTAMRSALDDGGKGQALEQQLQLEAKLDHRSAKASALMGIAECLRFGTTSVSDLYYFPDAVAEAADLVKRAASWGHKAVAITDHGVVQAFPDIMNAAAALKKKGTPIKVLYGMEAYFVNDMVPAVNGSADMPLDSEYIVFDIETTGLSNKTERITEIGAVRMVGER